jgi:rSAM/selenodomain-associated transferase 2
VKPSIIIPTLNEEDLLERTLASISGHKHEIIVVDGGSRDRTSEIACQYTPHVLSSEPGRGVQQHKGACHAQGDVLLFLHADTLLPRGFERMMQYTLADPEVGFGAFYLSIYPPSPTLNLIALGANLRSRFLKIPYGDQALFMRTKNYFRAGGFRDLPIMEDVDLVRRLNGISQFKLAPGKVRTSARRWEKERLIFTTLRNYSLMIRYFFGVKPRNLLRHYNDIR